MRIRWRAVLLAACLSGVLAGACGTPDDSSSSQTSGTAGSAAIITGDAGASVEIPAAVAPEEAVTVRALDDLEGLPPTGDPDGFAGGVELEPHGLDFAEPVTVTIPLTRQLPAGLEARMFYWDGEGTAWEETEFVAVVHDDGWTASGGVTHFSYYVLQPSSIQADDDGIFGDLLEAASEATSRGGDEVAATEAVYSSMIGHVNARFPLYEKVLLDVPIPNGHNCYAPVGYFFLFDHARPPGLPEPLTLTFGDINDVEFRIDYVRDVDVTVKMGEVENQVAGTLVANIYWKSLPPEMSLTTDTRIVVPGETATLQARLHCGGDAMSGEDVSFFAASGMGTLDPTEAETGNGGTATSVFSPDAAAPGIAVVGAEFDWTNQRGDVSAVVGDTTEIRIRTVTGTWTVTGSETWVGCYEPEENGTYRGSGEVHFLETDGTITGFGEFPRSSDLIVGTVVWNGSSFTLKGSSNYSERAEGITVIGITEFTGNGSLDTDTIEFHWTGQDLRGDTCSFSGDGTAEYEGP